MQKRKGEENQPKNTESRELWLDETTLDEVANTSNKKDDENSTENEDED
jgi:hypothetical protein